MYFGFGAQLLMSSLVPKQRTSEPLLGQVQGQRLPRRADEAVAEEEVLVLVCLGIALRALGAWMCSPEDAVLLVHHLEHIVGRAEVIDMTIDWIFFFEGLARWSRLGVREVHGLGGHEIPVSPEIGIRLFGRDDQEILIRKP